MVSLELQDDVTPLLTFMDGQLADLTEPLTAILEDGLLSAQTQIVEGKGAAFGGSSWAPMAASTAKRRDPATLLFDTGALAFSLTRGAGGNLFDVGPTEVSGGTGIAYAGYQQGGTSRIPARPFLVWYASRFELYDQFVGDWIMGKAAGNA